MIDPLSRAPEQQNLATLWGAGDVSVTTEAIQLARDRQNHTRSLVALIGGCVVTVGIAAFLMWIYPHSPLDAQSKIITALVSLAAAAIGVIVGKKV